MIQKRTKLILVGAVLLGILYFVLRKTGILKQSVGEVLNGMRVMSENPVGYSWFSEGPTTADGVSRDIYKGPGGDFVIW